MSNKKIQHDQRAGRYKVFWMQHNFSHTHMTKLSPDFTNKTVGLQVSYS
jgi:hypothetical protein